MSTRKSTYELFWEKVDKTGGNVRGKWQRDLPGKGPCWVWTACRYKSGYGKFGVKGKTMRAHRVAFVFDSGEPIPEGLVLDHECVNPPCVNPRHLKAVTNKVNILAGRGPTAVNSRKSVCLRGHELSEENTYLELRGGEVVGRKCRVCLKATRRLLTESFHKEDKSPPPSSGELARLYVDEGLSYCEIGRRYGVSDNAVRKWAKKSGFL